MERKTVVSNDAPMAVGPYSQAVAAGNTVFVSGQIPVNPVTGIMPETIEEQTEQAMHNVLAILNAAGVRKQNIVSVTIYLTDIEDFSQVNLVYAKQLAEPYPARACVAVSALPKGAKIMIAAIGIVGE